MSLNPWIYLRLGTQTLLSTNSTFNSAFNSAFKSTVNTESFDGVIALIVTMLVGVVFGAAIGFLGTFALSEKFFLHIFHGYVLLILVILSGYATLYSTPPDNILPWVRNTCAVVAFALFLDIWHYDFRDYVRFGNCRSRLAINEKNRLMLGVLSPMLHIVLVVAFFVDERYLEGLVLSLCLPVSILFAYHINLQYFKQRKLKYNLTIDLLDRIGSESSDIANTKLFRDHVREAQQYEKDDGGFTDRFLELIY